MKSRRVGFVLGTIMTLAVPASSVNNSFEKATPLVCPFDISGTLPTAGDRDFYSVMDMPVGSIVLRWPAGDAGLKAVIYDSLGRWAGYLGQTASVTVVNAYVPQRYYIEVFSEDGVAHGDYRMVGEPWCINPERDGARLRLNFDSPGEDFVARSLIPLVARRMEVELAPYSCAVLTSQEVPEEQTTGEWVRVRVGSGGSLGGGGGGVRRPDGICGAGWSGAGAEEVLFPALCPWGWPPGSVISHEARHGFGIPHWGITSLARPQLDQGSTLIAGGGWSNVWNVREFMTILCQPGYLGIEVEPNNDLLTATDVGPWLRQMQNDDLQTNDAFVASGKIATTSDVDIYSMVVNRGEKWQFDIDAAEFQYPLDAYLEVLRASGEVLAESDDATDPHSGIFCADPFIRVQFPATERVYLRVSGKNGTVGGYHLIGEPEACFDKTGPRIYGVLPDGESSVESTSEVFVYFNEEVARQTLNATNVRLAGAATGPVSGKITFDSLSCLMRFDAEHPLEPDVYTLRLSGLTDYAGNLLDGETDGSFEYPEVSGDGVPDGDFLCSFTITKSTRESAPLRLVDKLWDGGSGQWLVFRLSDPIATASVRPSNLIVRNDGSDGQFDTPDDHLFPLLCWNYEVFVERPTDKGEIWAWMMAALPPGDYRCDYNLIDAAGRPVQGSIPFNFATWPAGQGPRIVRVSPNPDIPQGEPFEQIEVQFSGAMNPATITPETFHMLYSSTGTFFHGEDIPVTDADGIIEYDPVKYTATFKPAHPMGPGFYRVELSGRRGGIADVDGHLLDGEYLAAGIYKCNDPSLREASPSGNLEEGGDYTAVITVETPQGGVGQHH